MIQTILYATDLGWFSPHIMQHVLSMAAKCEARVIVVHAVEPLGMLGSAVVKSFIAEDSQDVEGNRIEQIRLQIKDSVIDAYAEEYMQGEEELALIHDVVVEEGKPAEVILNEASNYSADMIVMGRHGHNSIDTNLMGSVTTKVLQLAKMPVYMVPVMRNHLACQEAITETRYTTQ